MRLLPALVTLLAVPTLAAAEPMESSQGRSADAAYAWGARVGGYGFRRAEGDRRSAWDECRMNGIGIFGERALTPTLFVEAGFDAYFSESWPMQDSTKDLPIDRVSGLLSTALGVRGHAFGDCLALYAQVGGGLELTQVAVPYGAGTLRDRMALPDGFVGVGGDLRITDAISIGASMRLHVMGNFDYDPGKLAMEEGWTVPPSADDVFAATPDLAAQGQFYLRHSL